MNYSEDWWHHHKWNRNMTSRTNRTWRSCEDEKVGLKLGLVIITFLVIALTFATFAQAQGVQAQQQPIYQYEQTYAVPQTLYQEYRQTITVTPGQQYAVPQYSPRPMPRPFYRPKPRPRGVWGWGPFPMGYYY